MTLAVTPSEQQDAAAGGRQMRMLQLEDGQVVTASLEVVKIENHSWGYLRFKSDSATTRKYVGRVTAESREKSLRTGWKLVRANQIAEAFGWQWVTPQAKAKR